MWTYLLPNLLPPFTSALLPLKSKWLHSALLHPLPPLLLQHQMLFLLLQRRSAEIRVCVDRPQHQGLLSCQTARRLVRLVPPRALVLAHPPSLYLGSHPPTGAHPALQPRWVALLRLLLRYLPRQMIRDRPFPPLPLYRIPRGIAPSLY